MAISVLYSVEADHLFVLYNFFLFGRSKKLHLTYEQWELHTPYHGQYHWLI